MIIPPLDFVPNRPQFLRHKHPEVPHRPSVAYPIPQIFRTAVHVYPGLIFDTSVLALYIGTSVYWNYRHCFTNNDTVKA